MARTVQAGIDRVREILQDKDGTRYSDAELCAHFLDAVQQARSVRPDLFIGAYSTPLPSALAPADTLPLPDQLFATVCWYVSGAAELRDDEFAVDGRAMVLQGLLTKKLVSGM